MKKVCIILWAALWWTAVAPSLSADEIVADSLQYRLDRFYFPIGDEGQIYRYSPFSIAQHDTVVYRGYIEHSWTGMAVSFPTRRFFDTLDITALRAVLTTAELDSTSEFLVGIDPDVAKLFSDTLPPTGMQLQTYRDDALMWEDFADGALDGVAALQRTGAPTVEGEVISSPWPYVVVLVPNVGRRCNFDGQLTTSLYYRFDPSRLDLVWEGDAIPVNDSGPPTMTRLWSHRPYGYSPSTGRSLLALVKDLPPVIHLFCDGPTLRTAALFFADILAQDHLRVEIVERRSDADLYIEFAPASSTLPALTAHQLRYELSRDTIVRSRPAEYVAQIGRHMQYLTTATSEDDYYRTVEQVERKLTEDLGVFPLFYPVYFFHARPNVRGVGFNANGRLDFSHAYKVILPPPPPEVAP